MPFHPVTWVRVGDRYPDRKDEPDSFVALDGETEIGAVTFIATGSMLARGGGRCGTRISGRPRPSWRLARCRRARKRCRRCSPAGRLGIGRETRVGSLSLEDGFSGPGDSLDLHHIAITLLRKLQWGRPPHPPAKLGRMKGPPLRTARAWPLHLSHW